MKPRFVKSSVLQDSKLPLLWPKGPLPVFRIPSTPALISCSTPGIAPWLEKSTRSATCSRVWSTGANPPTQPSQKPAMLNALLFDLDNTLINRDKALRDCVCNQFDDPEVRAELFCLDNSGRGD